MINTKFFQSTPENTTKTTTHNPLTPKPSTSTNKNSTPTFYTPQTADIPKKSTSTYSHMLNKNTTHTNQIQTNTQPARNQPETPNIEAGIIFEKLEDANYEDYYEEIGRKIGYNNITFASPNRNRICVFLKTKRIVDIFLKDHKDIYINNTKLTARRYATPAKKLTLSRVCPIIPHEIIVQKINNIGNKTASNMIYLHISTTNPQLQHICSFRRQIYIEHQETPNIPEAITIPYEGVEYKIFCQLEDTVCQNCTKPGHSSPECNNPAPTNSQATSIITETITNRTGEEKYENTNTLTQIQLSADDTQNQVTNLTKAAEEPTATLIADKPPQNQTQMETNIPENQTQSYKRAAPNSPAKTTKKKTKKIAKKNKKPKTEEDKETLKNETKIEIEKHLIEQQNNVNFISPLQNDELVKCIQDIIYSLDPLNTALLYTNEIEELTETLNNIKPTFKSSYIKMKISRTIKKLTNQLYSETQDSSDETDQPDTTDFGISDRETEKKQTQ